jgi:hypothetical protein
VSLDTTSIRIANPPPGHRGIVGLKHAERWIRQARAFMLPDGQLFLRQSMRQILARATRRGGQAVPGHEYDLIRRRMRPAEVRRIPIKAQRARPRKWKVGERSPQSRRIVAAHASAAGIDQIQAPELLLGGLN